MGVYLLVAAGLVFALLFALNNLLKTLFRRSNLGFVDTLLAFLTTLVPLVGLILAQTAAAADRRILLAALVIGGGLAAFSLLILLLELFRPQRLKGSRGVLGLYSGLLLIAAVFIVPLSAETLIPVTPTVVVEAVSPANTAEASPLPRRATLAPTAAVPAASVTPEPTDTPRPTRSPSRTPFRFSTRTPTSTPTLVTPCVASVQYNLRLRAAPNRDAETLLTIPYGTSIELFAKGETSEQNARWWLTIYEDSEGWVDGQYMLVSTACERLPFRNAE